MVSRLRTLGIVVAVFGVLFLAGGGYAFMQVQAGYDSLQSFSEAQNVTLSYNDDGQLVDRGTTEGADAIMHVLTVDWNYPVSDADFDPNDPLVNTASEYMYQMATIGYHTLHGTQTVTLAAAVEYDGVIYAAGPHEVVINEVGSDERVAAGLGGYWTDFDRSHPLEGPARGQAWSGTAHSLFGQLGVGTVTASTLQIGLGVTALLIGLGLTFGFMGLGMVWVSRSKRELEVPGTVPEAWVPKDSTV
ncbi:MAG: hypothetical protein O3B42_03250 [Actinomycetota bacterium]|jgi:hypothetical protein|nr:hypothetical protein [Actinomycetota bacterium]